MRGTTQEIQRRAKELRKRMTVPEKIVWQMLRKHRQRGFYFRRQHPVGRFILDFCCAKVKLCVEIDGPIHDEQRERDAERTAWLEAAGYRVIRFRNDEVIEARHLVAERIQAALENAVPDPGPRTHAGAGPTTSLGTGEVASLSEPERALSRGGRGSPSKAPIGACYRRSSPSMIHGTSAESSRAR
jgi:very-short-patch-repair endonuclease